MKNRGAVKVHHVRIRHRDKPFCFGYLVCQAGIHIKSNIALYTVSGSQYNHFGFVYWRTQ